MVEQTDVRKHAYNIAEALRGNALFHFILLYSL